MTVPLVGGVLSLLTVCLYQNYVYLFPDLRQVATLLNSLISVAICDLCNFVFLFGNTKFDYK